MKSWYGHYPFRSRSIQSSAMLLLLLLAVWTWVCLDKFLFLIMQLTVSKLTFLSLSFGLTGCSFRAVLWERGRLNSALKKYRIRYYVSRVNYSKGALNPLLLIFPCRNQHRRYASMGKRHRHTCAWQRCYLKTRRSCFRGEWRARWDVDQWFISCQCYGWAMYYLVNAYPFNIIHLY